MEDLNPAKRVNPRPGDRFVIETEHHLPSNAAASIARYVAKSLGVSPDDVLVLDGGMVLSVVSPCDPRREADLLDANNRMHDRNVRLSSAIMAAVIQFRFYEAQHRAKGTPEADAKAEVNRQLAEQLDCVALGQGTTVGAPWRQFALAHQLAANLHGMLEAHVQNTGEALEADDAALVAEWVRQLDDVGQIALDTAEVGELALTLRRDPDDAQHPQDGTVDTMTPMGAIAVGGSALVRAFLHARPAQDHMTNEDLLRAFSAYAVAQLKGRAQAVAQGVITPEQARVVQVDFGKAGGVEGIKGLAPVSCPACGRNLYTAAPCCEKCPDGGVL